MNKNQNKLIKDIEKRCTTLMIGSLARFEDNFSYLWENNNHNTEKFEQLWEDTRHEILNFGNYQIRSIVEDLFRHFLNQNDNNKFHYQLPVNYNNNKQGDKE
jgi:hypothetical protein